MREGVGDMGLVRDGQMRVPVRRVPEPDIDGAAPLRGLGLARPDAEMGGDRDPGQGRAAEPEQVASGDACVTLGPLRLSRS